MKNAITTLRIQNFKSIKDVEIKPRRVNLILGEPNVGKSNILEATSLLGGMMYEHSKKFMGSFLRYEEPKQIFYDNLLSNVIRVSTNKELCLVKYSQFDDYFKYLCLSQDSFSRIEKPNMLRDKDLSSLNLLNNFYADFSSRENNKRIDAVYAEFDIVGNLMSLDGKEVILMGKYRFFENDIRYYLYGKSIFKDYESFEDYLNPPNGNNLFSILMKNYSLRKEISALFKMYGQKLSLRMDSNKLEIIKDLDDVIYSYPYSSVADTLQRLIFYLAAIESNDDAVLLFEEPEAHSFPTYVSQLGRRIIDSENNQFFVVTHSPYLVTEILEEMVPNDELLPQLAIFIAYYEDYQTKIRQLTDDEVRTVRANGTEMFYNLRQFTPAGQE